MDIVQQLESMSNEDGTLYKTAAVEIKKLRDRQAKTAAYHNTLPWYRRLGLITLLIGLYMGDPITFFLGVLIFMLPA